MPVPRKKPGLNSRATNNKPASPKECLSKTALYDEDLEENDFSIDDVDNIEDEDEEQIAYSSPKPSNNHSILYSPKAYQDHYDFSCLTKEEQKMTCYLYTSEDGLSDFYRANQRLDDESHGNGKFSFSVKVPCSGWYYGFVYEYKKSNNNPNFMVLKLLIDYNNIKSFTFPSNSTNVVYATIKREKGIGGNIFKETNYSAIEGCLVLVKIENKTKNDVDAFSEIVQLRFISDEEYDVLIKMINLMLKQSGH